MWLTPTPLCWATTAASPASCCRPTSRLWSLCGTTHTSAAACRLRWTPTTSGWTGQIHKALWTPAVILMYVYDQLWWCNLKYHMPDINAVLNFCPGRLLRPLQSTPDFVTENWVPMWRCGSPWTSLTMRWWATKRVIRCCGHTLWPGVLTTASSDTHRVDRSVTNLP